MIKLMLNTPTFYVVMMMIMLMMMMMITMMMLLIQSANRMLEIMIKKKIRLKMKKKILYNA
jgi:hypothetical protein